jgi:hypothetical protein
MNHRTSKGRQSAYRIGPEVQVVTTNHQLRSAAIDIAQFVDKYLQKIFQILFQAVFLELVDLLFSG